MNSYPKIYQLGHRAVRTLFDSEVRVEEKVDGSQLTFWVDENGEKHMRSKGKMQSPAPDKMFEHAWDVVQRMPLRPGLIYSGEYLNRPHHNTIAYERTPKDYIVLFDIRTEGEHYFSRDALRYEAELIGLEVVPQLGYGMLRPEEIEELLNVDSFLGGSKIEGVVVKSMNQFDAITGKALMGKYVSEAFKERNDKSFRARNPSKGDVLALLCAQYRTEARWAKAVQHLREDGKLLGEPKDIGALVKEVQNDLLVEEMQHICEVLWKWAWPQIERAAVKGLAEWYKKQLLLGKDMYSGN